jgi:hypothetical protein
MADPFQITSPIAVGDAVRALTAAYPGERFTVWEGPSAGLIDVSPENVNRSERDITDAFNAWDAAALDRAKASRVVMLNARRDAAMMAFVYLGHAVPLTTETKGDVAATLAGLQNAPDGTTIQWEITAGAYLEWGLADLVAFGAAAFAYAQACYARSAEIAALIAAAPDAGAAWTVDLDSGWPG